MSSYSESFRFENTNWKVDVYNKSANQFYKKEGGRTEKIWRQPVDFSGSPTMWLLRDEELAKKLFRLMNFVDFIEYEVVNVRFYDCIMDTVEGVRKWNRGIEISSVKHFAFICGSTMEDGKKALNIAFSQRNR